MVIGCKMCFLELVLAMPTKSIVVYFLARLCVGN